MNNKGYYNMKQFQQEYEDNIKAEMIQVVCDKCNQVNRIFPEHLDRAKCFCGGEFELPAETQNKAIQKAILDGTVVL